MSLTFRRPLFLALLAALIAAAVAFFMPGVRDAFVPAANASLARTEHGLSRRPGGFVPVTEGAAGLDLRLSDAAGTPPSAGESHAASGAVPMSDAEAAALLARLPALEALPGDRRDAALPPKSLPPPRTGATRLEPWPPASTDGPPTVVVSPLEVVRHAPEGDVPLAARVALTFSQPMIAVGTHDQAERTLPAKLTPQPPGKWRWAGSQLLIFEGPDAFRLPMATRYEVDVPAGTKSAVGGILAAAHRFSFATPPPRLEAYSPNGGPQVQDPLILMRFDQRVDAAAVHALLRLVQGSEGPVPTRLLDPAAKDADGEAIRAFAGGAALLGRVVAVRATRPLPKGADCTVNVPEGTPSAEGPLATTSAQAFSFSIHGPLRIVEHRCGWQDGDCPPDVGWRVRFSNPLDAKSFAPAQVSVAPAVEDLDLQVSGDHVFLSGAFAARTTYRVTFAAELRDDFGQQLGEAATVTFKTGPARPQLLCPAGDFVVLDPAAPPALRVYSAGQRSLKVKLLRVDPALDWAPYHAALQARYQDREQRFLPPGKNVKTATVEVSGDVDDLTETSIDLAPALEGGFGHVLVVIEPGTRMKDDPHAMLVAWVQATHLGLAAFVDSGSLLAWATDLETGRAAAGVALELGPGPLARGETDREGLAVLALPVNGARPATKDGSPAPQGALLPGEEKRLNGQRAVLARRGADVAFLPENPHGWWEGTSWAKREVHRPLAWHVFDDRGLYRPGETARVKGWIRRLAARDAGGVEVFSGTGPVRWVLNDSIGNEVAKGEAPLSALGGFDLQVALPPGMNLGSAQLTLTAPGNELHGRQLRVEEFRRPEFEVTASAGEGPFLVGGEALVTATAKYFAGGSLPDAEVTWSVTATPGDFRPPGWDEFTFGEWVAWWRGPSFREPRQFSHSGRTSGAGEHLLRLEFLSCLPPRATSVVAEATVQDVNRQAWSARSNLLVHPSDVWIGLRAEKPFVDRKQPFGLEVILTDRDGAPVVGREVVLRAARLVGHWSASGWSETEEDVVEERIESTARARKVSLRLGRSGAWTITARAVDDVGRANESVLRAWVAGDEQPEVRRLEQLEVELIPDAKEYGPGDTARVLVRAPFAPAEALLTLRLDGLAETRRLRLEESSTVIEIPIDERWMPGVTAQVDLVGQVRGTPAFASGSVPLAISTRSRALTVVVTPDEAALEPGGRTTLRLVVTDAAGRPAAAEVALVVADEAVLALTGYELLDPLATFYPLRGADVSDHHLRTHVVLGRPPVATDQGGVMDQMQFKEERDGDSPRRRSADASGGMVMEMAMSAPSMSAKMDSGSRVASPPPGPAIAVRTDMSALALFEPALPVGADGKASIQLKLPDSLTRYRVMAVAVTGPRQFGKGEATVTARRQLMVRPSLPRFLNFGDRAELPVVLQNQGARPLQVQVALRAENARIEGPNGFRVTVPGDDRVEVRFAAVTESAGTMRVQAVAVSGPLSDAAELSLPVWTPATSEAFATYGTLDAGAVAQPVVPPEDVLPQFGQLSLTTSSTALFELSDAVLSLWSYRFECSEQVASRLLGVLALRDALAAFGRLPPREQVDAAVLRDVEILRRRQSWNGDVGLWKPADAEQTRWPWVSVHASHALLLAKAKGVAVPGDATERAWQLLRQIESRIPRDYPDSCRRAIVAQALSVRQAYGDADPKAARRLFAELPVESHGLETLGFLLPTLGGDASSRSEADAILALLRRRAAEEAGTVSFTESYGDADWLVMHSSRRTDGVLLRALLEVDPGSDILPKLVRGLLGARVKGSWENTQEDAFILLAMDRYFAVHEGKAPDFTAKAWLGTAPLADQQWRGRSTERRLVEVPVAEVIAGGPRDVVISKEGTGRLYWRLGLDYVPRSLNLAPSQHGFVVERTYEAVEDAGDVSRDADGTWHVKAGALIRSRVTMVATARRTHVALIDPMPAGVEALNAGLATTQGIPSATSGIDPATGVAGESRPSWWWGPWFEHSNLRDDRAEAFASNVSAGAWEHAWVGRATTPGRFIVPPAKAEEMYHPETFGRSATDVVVVK